VLRPCRITSLARLSCMCPARFRARAAGRFMAGPFQLGAKA
jgi:hypothetical protein